MIKPKALKPGDCIGLVSPSSGLAGLVPHRVEQAKRMLGELGFKVKIGKNALKTDGYVSGSAKERVNDLEEMFRDEEVKGVISMIGGNHSNHLLPLLNYDMIRSNPKVFMGFSDITVLHLALQSQAGLVTFYGPAALGQFGENPRMLGYTQEYLKKALTNTSPIGEVHPSKEWTEEVLNWFEKKDLERPRALKPNIGYTWLRQGAISGPIMGGCITSMMHILGTKFWPDMNGKILLLETPEGEDFTKGQNAGDIDAYLMDLQLRGIFDQVRGIVFGRPFGYTEKEKVQLQSAIMQHTAGHNFPILYGIDIGHTDPMITIPLGVKVSLDSNKNYFSIDESGVN
ncbi:MAG TPA: S66 peptidase family protein [Candidatus Nanoarchaeia archaeon]|nr:S66 peptidase family protein [Candidatus Nanoarchaeia archaeon]